jgi:hypothetical protein
LAHLSPLGWEHINLTGDYRWGTTPTLGPDEFRPLRTHAYDFAAAAIACALVSKALRLNRHHRRGANDGDGASTRTGTDYRSNNIGDSNADNSPRNIPDKGRNKRVRQIYQNNRQPSLFEARKPRAQALTNSGEDIFS